MIQWYILFKIQILQQKIIIFYITQVVIWLNKSRSRESNWVIKWAGSLCDLQTFFTKFRAGLESKVDKIISYWKKYQKTYNYGDNKIELFYPDFTKITIFTHPVIWWKKIFIHSITNVLEPKKWSHFWEQLIKKRTFFFFIYHKKLQIHSLQNEGNC